MYFHNSRITQSLKSQSFGISRYMENISSDKVFNFKLGTWVVIRTIAILEHLKDPLFIGLKPTERTSDGFFT